ncbi:MAG TPA: transcription-repair coupling factor [Anaerovoracaceae bacterium]|nr:transcription-repair coupling factor [Anaerovoracaceae bacterium]
MNNSLINVSGVSDNRVAPIAAEYISGKKNAIFIVSSSLRAKRLKEDLAFFVDKKIIVLPENEETLITYFAKDREFLLKQIQGMSELLNDKGIVLIVPIRSAIKRLPQKEKFINSILNYSINDEVNIEILSSKLIGMGYERSRQVFKKGEFSIRGEIIDLFPPDYDNPIRIDLFDTVVDSIKTFDVQNQRAIENMEHFFASPVMHILPKDDDINRVIKKIKRNYQRYIEKSGNKHDLNISLGRIIETMEGKDNPQIYLDYVDYFTKEVSYIWDYMGDGIVLIDDPARIMEVLNLKKKEDQNDFETLLERGQVIPKDMGRFTTEKDYFKVYDNDCIIFTPFPEKINGIEKLDDIKNIKSQQMISFMGNLTIFKDEVNKYLKKGYLVHILASEKARLNQIKEYLYDQGIIGNILFEEGNLSKGMIFPDEKVCYISDNDIFQAHKKKKKSVKKDKKSAIKLFSDLNKGDYIVHENHGIGKFMGIETLAIEGEVKDYLKIRYSGTDTLYIPTEQMDIIQKYVGSEGFSPKLSRLSGTEWQKTKAKAKEAIMDIAEDLIKLYAERELKGGVSFEKDSVWQKEFEEGFPYEETDDQLRSTEEIKKDMEKPMAMDRLLCGDVGYGKTEVAARAVFKCLDNGKQAAILAPTTILVNQHYYSLKERFEKFPFKVEMLSRFKSNREQEEIIKKLNKGEVDLIIGTHRLISKDVKFKDLGLLVIDEEQRFGVKHKEKIKELKKDVDVLTLSATPIPRTLNMSLTGIRDMSVLEEPPEDRYPVQTYVTPFDDNLLKEIIDRELNREGQVFIVYNKVRDIDRISERISKLVPDANVAVGHGQMGEKALENIMIRFVEGEVDILIATTIVESGIDIPNANTMVILNADRFGLSQLYQLRGRVGRSNRIAYTYLMYDNNKVLSEVSEKRLKAIREFTEFGAGFKIAMRDMEIRGAGNVLGSQQHGHMTNLGYELYCKEVDRAVKLLRGEIHEDEKQDINVEIKIPAVIPASFIEDETLRLQMYKKIAQLNSIDDRWDIIDEFNDRFGDIPREVMNLIDISLIRALAEKLKIEGISEKDNEIIVKFGEHNLLNGYSLYNASEHFDRDLFIHAGNRPLIKLKTSAKQKTNNLVKLMEILDENKSG